MTSLLLNIILLSVVLLSCVLLILSARRATQTYKSILRNDEVLRFRLYILDYYPEHYDELPSYGAMLDENRTLTIDEYLPELHNKLVES